MKNFENFLGPGCAHCEMAKALLNKHNLSFKQHDISDPAIMMELQTKACSLQTDSFEGQEHA